MVRFELMTLTDLAHLHLRILRENKVEAHKYQIDNYYWDPRTTQHIAPNIRLSVNRGNKLKI